MDDCSLKYYSDVTSRKIDWLWYPYIPFGKITVIQGDPGEGKTTFVLSLLSIISNGEKLRSRITVYLVRSSTRIRRTIIPTRLNLVWNCTKRTAPTSVSLKSGPIRFHLTVTSLTNRSNGSTHGCLCSIPSSLFLEKTST